ncbi:MAG: hypothetical protein KJO07_14915 [Deltaproteobacteria bacterium]|nr:hypothetical protein [Deltaproteobacteria bacterium]
MAAAWLVGCGGGGPELPKLSDLPAKETVATLAGPLCEFSACKCREGAGDPPQAAPDGFKRYEVRLGPSDNELWVSIDKMVLYKSLERAEDCFYVDVAPGRHPVRLRVSRETGFGAKLKISELAPDNQGWYDTFDFQCGSPGGCDRASLSEWKAEVATYPKNIHDPCGSTKIREVVWQTGRLPDNVPPGDLQLDFILDVYKFAPTWPPGHQECARKE